MADDDYDDNDENKTVLVGWSADVKEPTLLTMQVDSVIECGGNMQIITLSSLPGAETTVVDARSLHLGLVQGQETASHSPIIVIDLNLGQILPNERNIFQSRFTVYDARTGNRAHATDACARIMRVDVCLANKKGLDRIILYRYIGNERYLTNIYAQVIPSLASSTSIASAVVSLASETTQIETRDSYMNQLAIQLRRHAQPDVLQKVEKVILPVGELTSISVAVDTVSVLF